MKVKDLFKLIESANVIASEVDGKKFYIAADLIDLEHNHLSLSINNVNSDLPYDHRFYNYRDFAATMVEDYSVEVTALVGYGQLAKHGNGIYTLGDEACKSAAIRFFIYRD